MTLSLWDYNTSDVTLETGDYKSSPSCLQIIKSLTQYSGYTELYAFLSKTGGAQSINSGRIISWFRNYSTNDGASVRPSVGVYFRNQSPLGDVPETNSTGYYLFISSYVNGTVETTEFGYCLGGTQTKIDGNTHALTSADGWRAYRISWWEEELLSATNLFVNIEYSADAITWIPIQIFTDSNNRWSGSAVNRCGLVWRGENNGGGIGGPGSRMDDTYIYKAG